MVKFLFTKLIFIIVLLGVCTGSSFGQSTYALLKLKPEEPFENVWVNKLDTDEFGTAYLIWVKESVALHVHDEHTEHVYILEGIGMMKLGDEENEVKAGDFMFIPRGVKHGVTVTSETPLKALSVQTPEFHGEDRHFVDE